MDLQAARGKDVALVSVSMRFGDFTAVEPSDLTIDAGEFFSILGPSGCGKTTILRIVSGFLRPTTGKVMIGGDDMTTLGPNKRPTSLIFQNLALFPLMKVWENVAFGLEARRVPKAERRRRAEELLDLVALPGQGNKRPGELSGGQRQRVAVARCLAVEPSVLLLDEPLSALDLKLRQHMRAELKSIQRKTGVTFVYITHDQGEALTMSDRIAVMNQGRFEQVARTEDLYDNPRTPFVATFLGEQNVFQGKVVASVGGEARVETPLGPFNGPQPGRSGAGRRRHALRPGRAHGVRKRLGAGRQPTDRPYRAARPGRPLRQHLHARRRIAVSHHAPHQLRRGLALDGGGGRRGFQHGGRDRAARRRARP